MKIAALFAILLAGPLQVRPAAERDSIDGWFESYWKQRDLKPAAPCDDAVFLRRVTLDLTGNLPTPEEIRTFLKSSKKDKREKKIDELLAGTEAAEYFAHLWVQWLMGYDIDFRDLRRLDLGGLCAWLKKAWTEDMPYDDFVWAILAGTGKLSETPTANFAAKYLVGGEPPAAL